MSLRVETFVVGSLSNNLYLLVDEAAGVCVVVDPSIGSERALERVRQLATAGIILTAIWNTHGHIDHVYDNARWQAAYDVPIYMHQDDAFWLERVRESSLWLGLPPVEAAPVAHWIQPGAPLAVGHHTAQVIHTPGHSPGSVSFLFDDGFCIAGDVLFKGSVGRTDLPGCSADLLQESLQRLCALGPATRILPGHGEPTAIAAETSSNPYIKHAVAR